MHAFNVPAAYTMAAARADASRDSAGVVFTLIIGAWIVQTVFWLWSLIDVLSWPVTTWDRAELSKARWVMRIVFSSRVPRQGRASNG